jgi:iron(III) transport system permease protein
VVAQRHESEVSEAAPAPLAAYAAKDRWSKVGAAAWLRRHALLLIVGVIVLVTTILPLATVLLGGFFKAGSVGLEFTLDPLRRVFSSSQYWSAAANTIVVGLSATALATLLGVSLAWTLVRTNVPYATLLERVATVPIFIPPFVGAFAWILLAAPRVGLFNIAFKWAFGVEPFDVYTYAGMSWVIGIYVAPYILMIVGSALRSMDPSLEEAGQISGLSRAQTALKITLPVLAPAILSGATLAFVITIGLFGTPVLLGWTRQILLLTSRIYVEGQSQPPAYDVMAILAVMLIVMSVVAMALQRVVLAGRSYVTVTGKGFRTRPIKLGAVRYVLLGFVLVYIVFTVVAPIATVLAASFMSYTWSGRLTMNNFNELFASGDVAQTLWNSLRITFIAATLATVLALMVSWISQRTRLPGRTVLEYAVLSPIAVPGMAFAIGVMFLWLPSPFALYGTMWIVILAFIGRFTGYAVRTISGSLVQVHPELEESARVCGYGWFGTLRRITLPLIRPSIVSSWILLYSIFITELSMVILLHTTETRTISILTFETWYAGNFSLVSGLSLLQLLVGVAVMSVVQALSGGGERKERGPE